MPMHKGKVIGGGVTLAGTAIGLYASGWPEYIRLHPLLPLLVLLSGIVLVVWGLFIPGGKGDAPSVSTAAIGGDNSGQQVSAAGDVHFHLSPSDSPRKPEVPAVPPPSPALPRLEIEGPINVPVIFSDVSGAWLRSVDGQKSLAIRVRNEEAPVHQKASAVHDIVAIVDLKSGYGYHKVRVNRAFWINSYSNQIDLDVGHSKDVLIGYPVGEEWHSFINPNRAPITRTYWDDINTYSDPPEPMVMPLGTEFTFILTLITAKGETLLRRRFITRINSADHWYTEELA